MSQTNYFKADLLRLSGKNKLSYPFELLSYTYEGLGKSYYIQCDEDLKNLPSNHTFIKGAKF